MSEFVLTEDDKKNIHVLEHPGYTPMGGGVHMGVLGRGLWSTLSWY